MHERDRQSADRVRGKLDAQSLLPRDLRAALLDVPALDRDAWLDAVLGLDGLPDDGPDLPRDGVPYLPCAIDALLRLIDRAKIDAADVFVDVGSGVGRAAVIVHLLTGATAMGIEIQRDLARASQELVARMRLGARVSTLEGDAARRVGDAAGASIFFLYCPFSGERLAQLLGALEPLARVRSVRVATVDLPLPERPWLVLDTPVDRDLAIYRTTLHAR